MERAEAPAGQAAGDWWAAEVDVLPDAAVVNFVVQYYEHFDNNEGQDFRAVVEPAGGGCGGLACMRAALSLGTLRCKVLDLLCMPVARFMPDSRRSLSAHIPRCLLMRRSAPYRPGVLSRSLEEFEARKAEEIYANLRKQRADLERQWARKERLRAETRAKAKAGLL